MILLYKILNIMIFCIVLTSHLHASYIKIDTNLQTRLESNNLTVLVEVMNNGDEAAYDIMTNTKISKYSQNSRTQSILKVNESVEFKFNFELNIEKSGNYPVLVRIDYSDMNKYAFSAITLSIITYKDGAYPEVFCKANPLKIVDKGKAHLIIKNMNEEIKDITAKLIIPKTLSTPNSTQKLTLKPEEEKSIYFNISNFSAFIGTKAAIFFIVEYDDDEKHFATSVMSHVDIIEKIKLKLYEKIIIVGIPILLLISFFIIRFVRKRKIQ